MLHGRRARRRHRRFCVNRRGGGYLELLYVAAAHQRMGVGRLLGEAMLAAARAAAVEKVEADVSITGRPLFEALGFSFFADAFPEIDGVSLPNVVMSMVLNPFVRPVTRRDIARIVALDAAVFGGEGFGPYTWRQFFDLHAPFMYAADAYEADGSTALVGFSVGAIGHDGVGWLLTLGVSAAGRGLGLGRGLTLRTLKGLAAHGVAEVRLTVEADNAAARAIYASLGFVELQTEADYYGAGRDRLVMVRRN